MARLIRLAIVFGRAGMSSETTFSKYSILKAEIISTLFHEKWFFLI